MPQEPTKPTQKMIEQYVQALAHKDEHGFLSSKETCLLDENSIEMLRANEIAYIILSALYEVHGPEILVHSSQPTMEPRPAGALLERQRGIMKDLYTQEGAVQTPEGAQEQIEQLRRWGYYVAQSLYPQVAPWQSRGIKPPPSAEDAKKLFESAVQRKKVTLLKAPTELAAGVKKELCKLEKEYVLALIVRGVHANNPAGFLPNSYHIAPSNAVATCYGELAACYVHHNIPSQVRIGRLGQLAQNFMRSLYDSPGRS